ncbi:MAG TPA: hypothetical protein VIV58_09610 [Kofleriaceae bacterium]
MKEIWQLMLLLSTLGLMVVAFIELATGDTAAARLDMMMAFIMMLIDRVGQLEKRL